MTSLRLPRGLLADLEAAVLQHDRVFLREVATSLGLPFQDVWRKCVGNAGVATPIVTLWANPHEEEGDGDHGPPMCPWLDCLGDGVWRPCARPRLSPVLPCALHDRCVPCPRMRMSSDPYFETIGTAQAVEWEGRVYWWSETTGDVFAEDGTVVSTLRFEYIYTKSGKRVLTTSTALCS